jgi:hypothetical protein
MGERFVHGKSAKMYTSAFDGFFGVELKAVTIKKWAAGKTGERRDNRSTPGQSTLIRRDGRACWRYRDERMQDE